MTCTPTGAKQSDLTGDAAVLGNEGSGWLQLDSRTPRRPGLATGTCHKLCGGVRGVSGVPRAVLDCMFEQFFLTILSQRLMQLAFVNFLSARANFHSTLKILILYLSLIHI